MYELTKDKVTILFSITINVPLEFYEFDNELYSERTNQEITLHDNDK